MRHTSSAMGHGKQILLAGDTTSPGLAGGSCVEERSGITRIRQQQRDRRVLTIGFGAPVVVAALPADVGPLDLF